MAIHFKRPLPRTLEPITQLTLGGRIAEAALELDPFPHIVLPKVLPSFTIADLHAFWPTKDEFAKREAGMDGQISLFSAQRRAVDRDKEAALYWRAFEAGPVRQIVIALYHRYLPGLRARFGTLLPSLKLQTRITLTQNGVPPSPAVMAGHPATLFAAAIYLNRNSGRHPGVLLYEPLVPAEAEDGLRPMQQEDFRPVLSLPFADNMLVSYLRTANSFHGVATTPHDDRTDRTVVCMQVQLTDECVDEIYGEDVGMLFRDHVSGHCPWLIPTLDAWRARSWDTEPCASKTELQPILESFPSS